jgi:hypothetical protein
MSKLQVLTEGVMKDILVRHLKRTGAMRGATVISELNVAGFTRRADVVLVNGKLSAFEIKGELDKLDRLPGQLDTYSRYFENVTVVCAQKHTSKVIAMASESVGVWEVGDGGVHQIRPSEYLPTDDLGIWLSYLPVIELRSLLISNGISPGKAQRHQLLQKASPLELDVVRQFSMDFLKKRRVKNKSNDQASVHLPAGAASASNERLVAMQNYLATIGVALN